MLVKELIEALEKEDPEMLVCVDGYEGGYDNAKGPSIIKVDLNVNEEWYYGSHDEDGETEVIVLSRGNDNV